MRALLLVALLGCGVEPVDVGHVYSCAGNFYCLGREWTLTPQKGCATSTTEAVDLYIASASWITEHTDCEGTEAFRALCKRTDDLCTLSNE